MSQWHNWFSDPSSQGQPSNRLTPPSSLSLPTGQIEWRGITNIKMIWTGAFYTMIQYRIPIRNNTKQTMTYTFYDQDGRILDLSNYVGVYLELKLQGQTFTATGGTMLSPPSQGVVQASYTPTQIGVWTAQFYVIDTNDVKLYGDPMMFQVFGNVEDLALTQLPTF